MTITRPKGYGIKLAAGVVLLSALVWVVQSHITPGAPGVSAAASVSDAVIERSPPTPAPAESASAATGASVSSQVQAPALIETKVATATGGTTSAVTSVTAVATTTSAAATSAAATSAAATGAVTAGAVATAVAVAVAVVPPPATTQGQISSASSSGDAIAAAAALASAGDRAGAARVLESAVARSPADRALRLQLARAFEQARDFASAISQYNVLLEAGENAALLKERGKVHLWAGNSDAAIADLSRSVQLQPDVESMRLLGDAARWKGDLAGSRNWYTRAEDHAVSLRSTTATGSASIESDSLLAQSIALLDVAVQARLRTPGDIRPNASASELRTVSDNSDYRLESVTLAHAVPLNVTSGSAMGVSVESRSANRAGVASTVGKLTGLGVDANLFMPLSGVLLAGKAGVLMQDEHDSFIRSSVVLRTLAKNARLEVGVNRLPAYEALWSPRLLDQSAADSDGSLMGATVGRIVLDGELTVGTGVYLAADHTLVDDNNSRSSLALGVRRTLIGSLSLIYSGGYLTGERADPNYFSPERYLSNSLGLSWARYTGEGISYAFRALPGYASMIDRVPGEAQSTQRVTSGAFQMTASGEVSYGSRGWDLGVSAATGEGRGKGYRSSNVLLFVRRLW